MRPVVSNVPGTTRDSINTIFEQDGRTYRLLDAGVPRHRQGQGQRSSGPNRHANQSVDVLLRILILR
ncbi:unnamed protein product, partial [Ectocarpus sp. 8 AP-2014]